MYRHMDRNIKNTVVQNTGVPIKDSFVFREIYNVYYEKKYKEGG